LQLKTSRLTQNAFGRARWDDTIGYYWTRADGRALSISNKSLDMQTHKPQSKESLACSNENQQQHLPLMYREMLHMFDILTESEQFTNMSHLKIMNNSH
jgi:hypothetical protein